MPLIMNLVQKKMKKIIILIVLLLIAGAYFFSTVFTTPKSIHLKGKLSENYGDKLVLNYKGLLSELNDSLDIHIKLDKQVCFDTTIVFYKPSYYSINEGYGNWSNILYLTPGDDMEIDFNLDDGSKTIYKGKGSKANNYLAQFNVFLFGHKGFSFLNGRKNAKSTFKLTKQYVDSLAIVKIEKLNKTEGISNRFKEIETGRIYAHLAYSYLQYFYCQEGIYSRENIQKEHEKYLEEIKPEIIKIANRFMSDICLEQPDVRRVVKKIAIENKMLSVSAGSNLYDYVSLLLMNNLLEEKSSKETVDQAIAVLANIKMPEFEQQLEATINTYKKLLKGNKAYDIKLEDINGKLVKLSEFKGKILYVDFWATWCGPCIGQKPYFESLKKELNNPEIEFISISLDKKKESWKEFLKDESSQVREFIAKDIKKLSNDWQINFIPRFLIIDKDFNIVNANAPLPSSIDEIESELKSQLNL